MTRKMILGAAASLAFAFAGCGGGGGGGGGPGGGQDVTGTIESPAQGPQRGGQGAEPAAAAPAQAQAPNSNPAALNIGVQAVSDTPVDVISPHPGHEPLVTQVKSSPEPQPQAQFTKEWFVSPNGNDSGDGSQQAPFKSLQKGISAVGPGEVLRVQGGTYPENLVLGTKDGTAQAKITIQGEGKPKITGSGQGSVVQFSKKFWVLDGFDIDLQGKPVFAVAFTGNDEGSTLANSEVHDGTGTAGVSVYGNSNGAIVENNHIHGFRRTNSDSHGVVIQPTSHNTVVRNNDIHDVSGDDVQCIGPEGFSNDPPADGVVIENNHLYRAQGEGDGENATDIKTCHNVAIRNNRMHGFRTAPSNQGAKGDAIVVHLSAANVTVEGNDIFDSGKGIALGGNRLGGPMPAGVVIQRNTIHDLIKEGAMEGSGIRVENSSGAKILNNTIWNTPGPGLVLGHGTNGPTENLTVSNNIIGSAMAMQNGNQLPGLKSDGNLYAAGAQFQTPAGLQSFTQWQQAGQDAHSVTGDPAFAPNSFAPTAVAIDAGVDVGVPFCGAKPDIGAFETGC